jgi:hypothetical protein
MIKQTVMYFVINGIFAYCTVMGLMYGVEGALNLSLFIAWAISLLSLAFLSDEFQKKVFEEQPKSPVPAWIDTGFDLFIIGMFVWYGAIFTAIAYSIHLILVLGYRKNREEYFVEKLKGEGNV